MNGKRVARGIAIVALVALTVYNYINNPNFFITPIYFIINILIAVIFTYYFVQNKNDERKRREIAEKILTNIQTLVISRISQEVDMTDEQWKKTMMHKRSLNNKISALEIIGIGLGIDNHIVYIRQKFGEYDAAIGEADKKPSEESERIFNLIDEKCEYAIVDLYKRQNKMEKQKKM